MKTSDELLRVFALVRRDRNRLRSKRAGILCSRAEIRNPTQTTPCWKDQAHWKDDDETGERWQDQSDWCANCKHRQALTDELRLVVRRHAAALRGLLARGRVLAGIRVI